jgi:hypothetical protein
MSNRARYIPTHMKENHWAGETSGGGRQGTQGARKIRERILPGDPRRLKALRRLSTPTLVIRVRTLENQAMKTMERAMEVRLVIGERIQRGECP